MYDSLARVRESRTAFWSVAQQDWVAGQQPILEAGTVTIPGAVKISDTAGNVLSAYGTDPIPAASALAVRELPVAYTKAMDFDGGANPVYIGYAVPGTAKSAAAWRIQKLTYSGSNVTDIQLANGSPDFTAVWNNRAALSYT